MASNFDFLQNHHPELFHHSIEAEKLVYTSPRSSCTHCRFTLEQAVQWLYKHDSYLKIPSDDNLASLIHEKTFRKKLEPGLFQKIRIIHQVGNNAAHNSTPVSVKDAILLVEGLFHFLYWLSRSYSPDTKNHPTVNFNKNLIPRSSVLTPDTLPEEETDRLKIYATDRLKIYAVVITVLVLCGFIGIVIHQGIKNGSSIPTFIVGNRNKGLEAKTLTLGILSPPKYYQELSNYLKEELNNKVEIIIDGSGATSYEEARKKMISKEWDIAFTMSPILSVAAKNNNYYFGAIMFPHRPAYYQSVLFTRADSPIESINDLKSTHTIAMGDFNSASSFYVISYDLYGKTLNVNMGHKSSKIKELVKSGQADIGATAYTTAENDQDLKIIHVSRQIPGGNVYLSPNLSQSDRQIITNLLLNASDKIKKDANYGPGKEHDYSELIKISARTEEILKCSDFTSNPVKFYCVDKPAKTSYKPQSESLEILGTINGWTKKGANHSFKLAGEDNKIYEVIIPEPIFNQIPDAPNPIALQKQSVKIIGVSPEQEGNINRLKITLSSQFVVLKNGT